MIWEELELARESLWRGKPSEVARRSITEKVSREECTRARYRNFYRKIEVDASELPDMREA